MRHLLTDNHEDRACASAPHPTSAIAIYRALLAAGVVARLPEPDAEGRTRPADRRPAAELRAESAAVAVRAGRRSSCWTASPRDVAARRASAWSRRPSTTRARCCRPSSNKARGEAVAAMKADGIEYEERMELLEEVTYPKPLDELLRARLRRLPRGAPVGRRLRALTRSRWCATCTSGR